MMMNAQLVSILVMFISGVLVGAVIDGTRTILVAINIAFVRRLTFIIECLVWCFLGICTFYFLFLIKGGQWRVVDPLAQIAGIFMYELLFQKIFRLLGRILVNILVRPFFYIGHLFVRLVRGLLRFSIRFIKLLVRPVYKLFMKFMPNIFSKRK